jgi:hypothetical protein
MQYPVSCIFAESQGFQWYPDLPNPLGAVARIQATRFLIRAIRKIRIPNSFSLFGSGSSGALSRK